MLTYFAKVIGQPISEAEAYRRATPSQRAYWWPQGAPVKAESAGPAGVDLVDGGRLELAMAAGRRYQAAGYGGPLRSDGRVPCRHCAVCDVGAFERCRQARRSRP